MKVTTSSTTSKYNVRYCDMLIGADVKYARFNLRVFKVGIDDNSDVLPLKSPWNRAYCSSGLISEGSYLNRTMKSRGGSRIFLGGGALVSCSTSTPINHSFFFCRIPVVLENRRSSQGGVRTPAPSP